MGVTLSRAADRKQRPFAGGLPGSLGAGRRGREAGLIFLAAVVALLAMALTWRAVSRPLADLDGQLARGEVVNLNAGLGAGPGPLLSLLAFLPDAQERTFAAERIRRRLDESPLGNVGELGRLRVTAADVEARRVPALAARLAAAAAAGKDSVGLLSAAELRQLKPRVVVRTAAQYRASFLLGAALLLGGFAAAHLVLRLRRFQGDELLLPALLLLCGLGFVLMASLRDPLRDLPLHLRFAQGALAGCGLFVAGALVDLERTVLPRRGAWALVVAALLSALLIAFGGGPGVSDAKVNLLGFQPVELIKILIALFLAAYFADRWELLREVPERRAPLRPVARFLALPRLEYVLPPLVAIGLILFFFFLQKDLGPALVLAGLFLILFSVARGRPGMAGIGVVLVCLAFFTAYKLGYPRTVGQRIGMWLAPWDTWFHGGDHLAQAIWSLASGGAAGTGLGLGEPELVPEAHTDLVLSAIGEQLGFIGLLAVAGLYALLVQRGLRAARRAATTYGFFLALGFTLLIALETVVIAGGVLDLLPLSGVTSPFLSSGRSAMLANFLLAGVLAGIAARRSPPAAPAGVVPVQVAPLASLAPDAASAPFRGGVRWLAAGLGAFAFLCLVRLADFQLLRADAYLTRGAVVLQGDGVRRFLYNPRLAAIAATIPRGSIVDHAGVLLATSDAAELAQHQAELAKLGATDLAGAATELGGAAGAGGTPGDRNVRVYPFGGRTFHLLGDVRNRVNWRAHNTSFVERDARIRLQGYDDYAGVVRVKQPDGSEAPQVVVDYRELVPLLRHRYEPDRPEVQRLLARDRTVRLTVDVRLQIAAEDILAHYASQAGFGAAAVVLDAGTGDLLAAASYPYPDRLPVEAAVASGTGAGSSAGAGSAGGAGATSDGVGSALLDRARYGIYPPGSTFKVVTAFAALRKDLGLAKRTWECKVLPDGRDGNRVRGRWVRDDPTVTSPHGVVDLDKGIRHSCNAYFAQLATFGVGPLALLETAQVFGIPVARPNTPAQLDKALPQAAYGQGQVIATPFQMARVVATVAAAGRMPEGRWIEGEENPRTGAPVPVLDAAAVAIIARALRGVVTEGTAAAFLAGVQPPIAGKTGTAEVQDKKSHSWFIGYAPYGDANAQGAGGRAAAGAGGGSVATEGAAAGSAGSAPATGPRRIAFAVIVEHGGYGGRLAAPAAGEIVRRAAALGLLRQDAGGRTAQ
jgi:cell division protein FtsW (lipid II flippase)